MWSLETERFLDYKKISIERSRNSKTEKQREFKEQSTKNGKRRLLDPLKLILVRIEVLPLPKLRQHQLLELLQQKVVGINICEEEFAEKTTI